MEDSTIEFDHYDTSFLNFIPYESNNPAPVFSFDEVGHEKAITGDYDYEEVEPGFWRLHIDLSLKVNQIAELMTRSPKVFSK